MQWVLMMMVCFGMAVKGMGMLWVSAKKIKALTVRMETSGNDW